MAILTRWAKRGTGAYFSGGSFRHSSFAQRFRDPRLKFGGYVQQRGVGGNAGIRIDLEKAPDRDARLIETAAHRLADRNRSHGIAGVWLALQRPLGPAHGVLVALGPDVRICNSILDCMRKGVQRIQPHGAFEMLDCDVGLSEPDPAPAAQIPDASHVWIESKGSVHQSCALGEVAGSRQSLASPPK